jgi:hypothetical protein
VIIDMRPHHYLAIVPFVVPLACHAGEIQIDIRPSDVSTLSPTLSSSPEIKLDRKNGQTWEFSFVSNSGVDGTLTVAIENPPAGYDRFRMELDVPFYLGTLPLRVAAAVSNDELNDTGAADFVHSVGIGPDSVSIAENVVIHERARRYWLARSRLIDSHLRAANTDDVLVAYWLLYTTRNLIITNFVGIDDVTESAVNFMKTKVNDPTESGRLFGPSSVSTSVVSNLVSSIEARDSYLYYVIVNKLENHLRINDYSICDRIRALGDKVMQMEEYQLAQFNGEYPTTLKSKSDLISCLAHEVALAIATKTSLPSAELTEIDTAIYSAADDIAAGSIRLAQHSSLPRTTVPKSVIDTFDQALQNLQQRVVELKIYRKSIIQ